MRRRTAATDPGPRAGDDELPRSCGSCAVGVGTGAGSSGERAAPARPAAPFLDQTQEVPAGREWMREVTSRAGGTIAFRVDSQGPFAVTVITDKGMQAVKGGSGPSREDLLLTADSRGNTHEGKIALSAGSSSFIIENRAGRPATLRLVCSDAR